MRYLVAMILAVAAALVAAIYLSSPVASWAVDQMTFESPDEVANLHSLVFMGMNVLALAIGWSIGWALGSPLERKGGDL